MNKKSKFKSVIYDIGILIAGSFLFAIAYNMFYTPGNVFTGGAGGLALAINKLTGFPTGVCIILINIPLALAFVYFYGIKAGLKSIIGAVSTSVAIDVVDLLNFLPKVFSNPDEYGLLYGVCGGVALGLGVGILFTRGFSTGGSDYGAFLLRMKFKKLSTAKLILVTDLVVILVASLITNREKFITSFFFSLISIVVESLVLEFVTSDHNRNKVAYIFSDKYEKISQCIVDATGHGVTLLDGTGFYTKELKKIIMVVVRKNELHKIKDIVKEIDQKSFMILCDATETIGEGFKETVYDTSEISPRKKRQLARKNKEEKTETE